MPVSNTVVRYPALRVLRRGDAGPDVRRIQFFLAGHGIFPGHADGEFGSLTEQAAIAYQRKRGLTADGVIGPRTMAVMLNDGLDAMQDLHEDADWPAPADHLSPLMSNRDRERKFGAFKYRAAPEADNPEAIDILDDWPAKNLVREKLPIISQKFCGGKPVAMHRLVAADFIAWLSDVEKAGLASRILSYDGMWCARFIRGSRQTLSAHAWATAIDINADENGLGCTPPAKGKHGSVRELAQMANAHNLYWGGHFKGRRDGMHFEHVG